MLAGQSNATGTFLGAAARDPRALKLILQIPDTTFLHFWFELKSFQGLNS